MNLCRYPKVVVQELRGEVCPVGPDNIVQFRIDPEASENFGILQWFEDGAVQLCRKVDFAFHSVAELEAQHVTLYVTGINKAIAHSSTPRKRLNSGITKGYAGEEWEAIPCGCRDESRSSTGKTRGSHG